MVPPALRSVEASGLVLSAAESAASSGFRARVKALASVDGSAAPSGSRATVTALASVDWSGMASGEEMDAVTAAAWAVWSADMLAVESGAASG